MSDAIGLKVAGSINAPSYDELIGGLSPWERPHFTSSQKEYASRITGRVDAIEFA